MVVRKWLENQLNGKLWENYLSSYSYKKIAVYGAGELGRYFAMELKSGEIQILTYVDRNAHALNNILGIPVVTLDEFMDNYSGEEDALIVTAPSADDDVLQTVVCKIPDLPVMSLRDMIFEM